jgi:hypothetical protein
LVAMATDRLKYSQNNNIYDDSKYWRSLYETRNMDRLTVWRFCTSF